MFLAWAIMNDLEAESHRKESPAAVAAVRAKQMTGRQFLFKQCDGKFWEEDLSDEGNAFAQFYYGADGTFGPYLADYEAVLVGDDLASSYHVEDTWQNYDKIAAVISRKFEDWKQRR